MGNAAGQGPQLKALIEAKKSIDKQTAMQVLLAEKQVDAIKKSKMKHA
jgi:hypothetical protein